MLYGIQSAPGVEFHLGEMELASVAPIILPLNMHMNFLLSFMSRTTSAVQYSVFCARKLSWVQSKCKEEPELYDLISH